jgi:hypothetical protein
MATEEVYIAKLGASLARMLGEVGTFTVDLDTEGLGFQMPDAIVTDINVQVAGKALASGGDILREAAGKLDTAAISGNDAQLTAALATLVNGLHLFLNAAKQLVDRIDAKAASLPEPERSAAKAFAQMMARKVIDSLIITFLEQQRPRLAFLLKLLGLIDWRVIELSGEPNEARHIRKDIRLERIKGLFNDPAGHFANVWGWGTAAFDPSELLSSVLAFYHEEATIKFGRSGADAFLQRGPFRWSRDSLVAPPGLRLDISADVKHNFDQRVPLSAKWGMDFKSSLALGGGAIFRLKPPFEFSVEPKAGTASGAASFMVNRNATARGLSIIGGNDLIRLTAENVGLGAELTVGAITSGRVTIEPGVSAELKALTLSLGSAGSDNFLASLLAGADIKGVFDIGLHWTLEKGLMVKGAGGLEITIPMHQSLGIATFDTLYIILKIRDDGLFALETSAGIKGQLGPLAASVERMGANVTLGFSDGADGNLGPINLDLAFKPPNGVGLSLDVGIIKGGGFLSLDVDKGEYAGAMELDFIGIISLKAIAIINTKMPDGSKGFSLLIIITADFPPIQLGFGFTLNAVGGLLGLNRTVNLDALREGVRTNAIKSVLFPQDVIANITRIVSDLKQIFPPLEDHFIVGPMAELGWGTPSIITLELGILIEIPVPRIAILGVLAAFLPAEELALLRIQVNFLGVIDFENKYISFDASLFDSRLLIYTLTGDMAFRLSWGDNPMFILSVGGFHPAYHDAPQDLQHMTRLGISLLSGDNPRISVLSYFAVTSNTVQFGARAELYAEAAGFNVYGFIGYDVLFQFDPFKFIASFEAGLALREGTDTIMGIHLAGQLSGINPWNARGEASITILFLEVSVSFDETWGDSADKIDPPKEDIVARLTAEINDNRNWRAEIPDSNNLHVSIRKMELPPDQVVIHPMGVLSFSERLVPLGLDITKFGNKVPLDAKRFDIKATDPGILTQTVTEEFAPANFFDKNDSEKLSSPSFDRLASGFKVTGASSLVMPTAVNKSVEYELTYLREKRTQLFRADDYLMASHVFKASTKANAAAVSTLSYARNRISVNAPDSVAVAPPQYAVANVSDMRLAGPDLVAGSYTEAQQKYSALIAHRPELKDQVQVLAHHELNND